MSYLCFTPDDYTAVAEIARPLNLNRYRPLALKRFLTRSLAAARPELAERIARFRRQEIHILHDHLRRQRPARERHDLTADEVAMLAEAFGPALFQVRFLRPLKRRPRSPVPRRLPRPGGETGPPQQQPFRRLVRAHQGAR